MLWMPRYRNENYSPADRIGNDSTDATCMYRMQRLRYFIETDIWSILMIFDGAVFILECIYH
jgi:hypothetical protein